MSTPLNEVAMKSLLRIMYYQRLAIKPDIHGPWEWYGGPIGISPANFYNILRLVEERAKTAMMLYELNPLRHMKLVQAPTEEAYTLMDMWED